MNQESCGQETWKQLDCHDVVTLILGGLLGVCVLHNLDLACQTMGGNAMDLPNVELGKSGHRVLQLFKCYSISRSLKDHLGCISCMYPRSGQKAPCCELARVSRCSQKLKTHNGLPPWSMYHIFGPPVSLPLIVSLARTIFSHAFSSYPA